MGLPWDTEKLIELASFLEIQRVLHPAPKNKRLNIAARCSFTQKFLGKWKMSALVCGSATAVVSRVSWELLRWPVCWARDWTLWNLARRMWKWNGSAERILNKELTFEMFLCRKALCHHIQISSSCAYWHLQLELEPHKPTPCDLESLTKWSLLVLGGYGKSLCLESYIPCNGKVILWGIHIWG